MERTDYDPIVQGVGTRKAPALPEGFLRIGRQFAQIEAAHFDDFDAPGQRLGSLSRKIGRSATKNQKRRRLLRTVGQHAQHWEERGLALRFINHHQTPQALQRRHGLLQEMGDDRIFQVEVLRVSGRHHLAGESGLAALTGAKQSHHGTPSQGLPNSLKIMLPRNHACNRAVTLQDFKS